MFITGFVTRIKCAFRDKEMIFWTLLFPVMLATLFYFCFSNLDSADAFFPGENRGSGRPGLPAGCRLSGRLRGGFQRRGG